MVKIAIIGGREFQDLHKVMRKLYSIGIDHLKDVSIISGGARGIDQAAKVFAEDNDIKYIEVRPINSANKLDYLYRNVEIITMADKIIAFWDGKSRGTKFVIDYATARKKETEVIKWLE